jgi:hypothetical protein
MLVGGAIDGKCKFTADGNKTTWDIRVWNRARVPRIKQEKDGLKGNTDRVMLIGHDLQALHEVAVNMLNNHGVVVITRKNMAIDL